MASSGQDEIMSAMMDEGVESGVDFSFDLVKFVTGEDEGLLWNDNNAIKYTQPETMLDPALITGIALNSTSASTTPTPSSTSNPSLSVKDGVNQINGNFASSQERKIFETTTTSSSFIPEQHNPWGEDSNTSEYSRNPNRNLSPFSNNEFENSCQNRNFSILSNGGNISSSNYNHHFNIHHQQQQQQHHHEQQQQQQQQQPPPQHEQRLPGETMLSNNGDYLQPGIPTTSWTDRQMSNGMITDSSNNNKMGTSSGNGTCSSTSVNHHQQPHQHHHHHQQHGLRPSSSYINGSSAAFNLQQLHHGICSVGSVPSWQQNFGFADCASTNVPSQNDEGNDTRIPMPLSMSSIPTPQSSSNSNTTNNNNNNDNHQHHLLRNGHCQNGGTPNFLPYLNTQNCPSHGNVNGQQQHASSNPGSSFHNETSGQSSSSSPLTPQMEAMAVCSKDSVTLSFSAFLLNGDAAALHRSPQHSPLSNPSSNRPRSTESPYPAPEYVKMGTPTRNVRLRTNTKLDMDRQKAQEEDRRDKELQKQQQRAPIQSTAAVPVALPPAVNVVVPSKVLQVTSALENPTPFHLEQTQRFKIRQYCAGIANSLPEVQGTSSLGGNNPAVVVRPPAKINRLQHLITEGAVSSAPPNYSTTPLSPISAVEPAAATSPGPSQRSSVATSANDEFEETILDLLLTDEKTGDQVASLPQPGFNRVSGVPEASSSCPADSTKDVIVNDDPVKVSKDRIKKDNHNKIERKRRFHINDMITEQGRLLPKPNERHHEKIGEVKQNKGSILKASVDYTRVLKQDNEVLYQKLQKAEQEKKELLLRLQRVEQLCKQSGVQIPADIVTWKTGSTPEDLPTLLTSEVRVKQEPMYPVDDFDPTICDMMDEDRSIVTGNNDPMFGQVEADDGFHHTEGMDFND